MPPWGAWLSHVSRKQRWSGTWSAVVEAGEAWGVLEGRALGPGGSCLGAPVTGEHSYIPAILHTLISHDGFSWCASEDSDLGLGLRSLTLMTLRNLLEFSSFEKLRVSWVSLKPKHLSSKPQPHQPSSHLQN